MEPTVDVAEFETFGISLTSMKKQVPSKTETLGAEGWVQGGKA